jgi:HYR domain-containing protein/VCBS repeat protein/List-Bact-rpt repeat protein
MPSLPALRCGFVCAAIAAGVLATGATAHAQSTVLVLDSQPGEYVGEGLRRTYTPADLPFQVERIYHNAVNLLIGGPAYVSSWRLAFGSGGEVPLTVGSYRDARWIPFTSFNGMDVSGDSRGCGNDLTGRFDVLEVVYAPDGTVLRFAADFEAHCGREPALFGAIRYNSTIVDAVPFGGRYPSYELTITANPGGTVLGENIVCGEGASRCTSRFPAASFQLLKAVPAVGYRLLEWTGACSGGEVVNVHVNGLTMCAAVFGRDAPVDPRNRLVLDSQTGDYIGLGLQQRFGEANSIVAAQTSYLLRFDVEGKDGSTYTALFRAPGQDGYRLSPGEYTGATRAPFSYPGPGLDVSGNGWGCNTVAGRFTVYESVYENDEIVRFAADFEQHCDGIVPALFGSLRYNSTAVGVLPFGGAAFRVTTALSPYGSVTGGGMHCGDYSPLCTATRSTAGPLTLTATPLAGYELAGWTGDCAGTSSSTIVVVDAPNRICSAHYVRISVDTAAPVLSHLPENQRVLTTNPAGAMVSWMPPVAADDVDGAVAVACSPASHRMFPVGDTVVTCTAADRSGNQATTSFTVTVEARPLGADLNDDGQADLLWRGRNGEIAVWMMSGQTRASTSFLDTISTAWRIAAVGDFTGDGRADFVWQQDTGMVVLWEMQGTSHVANHVLFNGYTPWRVAAAGDLNGDGHVDLIWQGPSGSVAAWMMRGLATESVEFLYENATPWRVVAAADLDRDGVVDVIWQSPAGGVAAWLMNRLAPREVISLFSGDTDWRIEGIANLNGDSSVDLVWQSPSGTVFAWLMNGVDRLSVLPLYEGTDWRITGPR